MYEFTHINGKGSTIDLKTGMFLKIDDVPTVLYIEVNKQYTGIV
jgi:hypothetical protein